MTLEKLIGEYSVCKMDVGEGLPVMTGFYSLSVTDKEVSILCGSEAVPASAIAREDGWKGFRVVGQLDFSLVGILAELSAVLAREEISVFVTSTYDTDYLFVKKENFVRACEALRRAGHIFTEE